jgi:hypothetical protein
MNHTISSQEGFFPSNSDRVTRLDRVSPIGGLIGGVCFLILAVSYFTGNSVIVAGSWMFGWYFWFSITIGMFGLSVLHHTLRPTWSLPFLRLFEAGGGPAAIALMGVLFLPILVHPATLYEWARPEASADAILRYKAAWLNQPFWTGRIVFYFAFWIWFSGFMKRSERRQEETGDFALEKGRSSWGAFGMVMSFLTITFCIIDVLMSMEAHWSSTMMPLWQIIASCLGASSFCVALICINARKEPYINIIGPNLTKDWGNILFMFSMLWAYTAISQFLIIWNGNIPETAQYYARRAALQWNAIGMVTIFGQFLVPWMSLLSPRVKRYPRLLRQIAGWIFVIHIVDVYLAVGPALPSGVADPVRRAAFSPAILFDLFAWVAVGGIWLWLFGNQVSKAPLLVSYDQRLQEALVHAH